MDSPVKKSKKNWCKRISCIIEGVYTIGLCVPRDRPSEKVFSADKWKIGIKSRRHILQGHMAPHKNTRKKGPSHGVMEKMWTSRKTRRKTSRRINVVRGEINEKTTYIQARSSMARALEVTGKKAASMTIGKSMDQEILTDPWTGFTRFYVIGRKNLQTDICGPGWDKQENSWHPGQNFFMARTLGQNGKECQAEGEAKVVAWKVPSWKRTKIAWDLFHRPRGYGIQRNHQERA